MTTESDPPKISREFVEVDAGTIVAKETSLSTLVAKRKALAFCSMMKKSTEVGVESVKLVKTISTSVDGLQTPVPEVPVSKSTQSPEEYDEMVPLLMAPPVELNVS